MKKILLIILSIIFVSSLYGCSSSKTKDSLTIYSAGDYINPEVLDLFKKETGIDVIYEEYDTNEVMYTKISSPNSTYDIICTSDYMLEKLISEDRLDKLNYNNISNSKYISKPIHDLSRGFDSNTEYTVPYCYGTVGILYNSKYVSEDEARSWNILWNPKYSDEILMPDNVRDMLAVAMKKNGYSLNTSDPNELKKVENDLISQKDIVQAYVNDQVKDKMISEEAKIAVIYSGDALFTKAYREELNYVVPNEGSNVWIDAWAILKKSNHKEMAEKFINFITRPDIAALNYEYLTYSTPNTEAIKLVEDEELRTNEIVIPSEDTLYRCEVMKNLGYDKARIYNELFMRVKMH